MQAAKGHCKVVYALNNGIVRIVEGNPLKLLGRHERSGDLTHRVLCVLFVHRRNSGSGCFQSSFKGFQMCQEILQGVIHHRRSRQGPKHVQHATTCDLRVVRV